MNRAGEITPLDLTHKLHNDDVAADRIPPATFHHREWSIGCFPSLKFPNGLHLRRISNSPVTIGRVAHLDDAGKPHRKRPYVLSGIAVAVLMLAVCGVLGGFRAQSGGPANAKPGTVVHQGLFDVQITDARAGRIQLDEFTPAKNLLLVRMRVTDLGDQSYGISTFMGGIGGEVKPGTYATADFMASEGYIGPWVTSMIHPRLPLTVQLVWPLGNAFPRTATLALRKWDYRQGFTDDEFHWDVSKQSPIKAKVTLPVRQGATS